MSNKFSMKNKFRRRIKKKGGGREGERPSKLVSIPFDDQQNLLHEKRPDEVHHVSRAAKDRTATPASSVLEARRKFAARTPAAVKRSSGATSSTRGGEAANAATSHVSAADFLRVQIVIFKSANSYWHQ
eukprot:SAG11_NODE_274_length_11310_cov_4.717510_12_plen_129_part_00